MARSDDTVGMVFAVIIVLSILGLGIFVVFKKVKAAVSSERMRGQSDAGTGGSSDWNQYIRDQAQRVVYLNNEVVRGGPCFPELVGQPVQDAARAIKASNPHLYIQLVDERVPQRFDIWFTEPNRVMLWFNEFGQVTRIPMSG